MDGCPHTPRDLVRCLALLAPALLLVGCNLPFARPPALTPTADATRAQLATRSVTHRPPQTPTAADTPSSPAPSRTAAQDTLPAPIQSMVAVPCDRAAPGNPSIDVTIVDDTRMQPGEAFTKIWRLRNDGTCTWTSEYSVVWFSGTPLGAARASNLTNEVHPGQSIDVALDMVAPDKPGIYQSNWKLSNVAGALFGIGPSADSPFWVRIQVEPADTATAAPTAAPTATPAVAVSGPAALVPGDALDLDSNQVNPSAAEDLLYELDGSRQHWLTPRNGARLAQVGLDQPTMADCQSTGLSDQPAALDGLTPGTYFCYRTSMALPGWARLASLNAQTDALTLEILTWSAP